MQERSFGGMGVPARHHIQKASDVLARKHQLREARAFLWPFLISVEACGNQSVMLEEVVLEDAVGSRRSSVLRKGLDGDAAQLQPLDGIPDLDIRQCVRGSNSIFAPNIGVVAGWVLPVAGIFLVRCLVPLSA